MYEGNSSRQEEANRAAVNKATTTYHKERDAADSLFWKLESR